MSAAVPRFLQRLYKQAQHEEHELRRIGPCISCPKCVVVILLALFCVAAVCAAKVVFYDHAEYMLEYQRDCNMITKYDKTLNTILENNAGIITSAEAQEAGATRPAFSDYVRRRSLERTSRGVYIDPDVFPDEMALLQKRFPKAVFSHDSALFLHDLTDREPMPISVTVDSSYNASSLRDQGVRVYYVKPEWYKLGLTEVKTPSGFKVKAYDKERTICDLIRKRATVDPAVFRRAIRDYVRSRDKDLARLSAYACAMNMEPRVFEVMEVAM